MRRGRRRTTRARTIPAAIYPGGAYPRWSFISGGKEMTQCNGLSVTFRRRAARFIDRGSSDPVSGRVARPSFPNEISLSFLERQQRSFAVAQEDRSFAQPPALEAQRSPSSDSRGCDRRCITIKEQFWEFLVETHDSSMPDELICSAAPVPSSQPRKCRPRASPGRPKSLQIDSPEKDEQPQESPTHFHHRRTTLVPGPRNRPVCRPKSRAA